MEICGRVPVFKCQSSFPVYRNVYGALNAGTPLRGCKRVAISVPRNFCVTSAALLFVRGRILGGLFYSRIFCIACVCSVFLRLVGALLLASAVAVCLALNWKRGCAVTLFGGSFVLLEIHKWMCGRWY